MDQSSLSSHSLRLLFLICWVPGLAWIADERADVFGDFFGKGHKGVAETAKAPSGPGVEIA